MNEILRFFLHNIWEKSKSPAHWYVFFFVFTLMLAYASMFSFLVEIFGTTTRVFPAVYLSIAAISWGIRGAIPVTILNVALNILLFKHSGRVYEGGFLGPAGCFFATSLVGMISDLTRQLDQQLRHRRAIEADLRNGEERYRQIFNMTSDAIMLIDNETEQILEANASASNIYGYTHDELLQMRSIDISAQPQDTQAAIHEQIKHVPLRYHKKKNGLVFPTEITAEHFTMEGRQVHIIAIRDIASRLEAEKERKRLEAQFFKAQKLESIGTLAGGIAHDFNNLLGGIMGHTSLGLLEIPSEDPAHEHLAVIEKLAESGGKLTKHLLGFARGGKYEVTTTNLNDLISRHNNVFGRTHKHIHIDEKLDPDLFSVEVDQGQIEQILFNIYINSDQAMPGKGTISVSTENTLLLDSAEFPFPVKPGEYIKLTIRDDGNGMDDTTRQRIFEPFFSTKEIGVGTGLGMAAVFGIVKNHGGYIHVLSKLGGGTTIIILFPRSNKECMDEIAPLTGNVETGSGTILVVDDEEEMLQVVTEMLKALGYNTLAARNGRDAVSMFHEKKEDINLVVMDMIMPDLNGEETFSRLKKIDADVKVLFQTGLNPNQASEMEFIHGCCGILRKPFTIGELSEKIKLALNPFELDDVLIETA